MGRASRSSDDEDVSDELEAGDDGASGLRGFDRSTVALSDCPSFRFVSVELLGRAADFATAVSLRLGTTRDCVTVLALVVRDKIGATNTFVSYTYFL